MVKRTMNRTTSYLLLILASSFIFPAAAISYAQAASTTPNESTQKNATSASAIDEAPPANMTENNANMTGESTEMEEQDVKQILHDVLNELYYSKDKKEIQES